MKTMGILLSFILLGITHAALADKPQLTPEQQFLVHAKKIWDSLDRQHGEIKLPNGVATLHVPDNFYYLNPKDTETVLVDVWHNPPGAAKDTLGMLFPEKMTPFDRGSWGVSIEYEEDGYVSDDNADEINYDDILSKMQQGTRDASKQRVKQGYEPIELVGWAARPFYDKTSHKLHWAKEIKFGDEAVNTLNYNIRVLGRKGVLVLNFIAGMDQKPQIDANIDTVLHLAEFNQGFRYDEFNPDIDKVATYGIGALIAGKMIAKTGILITALLFLKKFGIMLLVGLGAISGKLFKRKQARRV